VVVAGRPYYVTHGIAFRGGYYFAGRDHHHWAYRTWDATYRCYQFYDADLRAFFYWCPERLGYYPVVTVAIPAPAPIVIRVR
jgi:hypothetical protein